MSGHCVGDGSLCHVGHGRIVGEGSVAHHVQREGM